jgi:signal transduction histidine kinase
LFYQDAYDPQELLNRLNRILATTLDVDQLLTKTTALIEKELKSELCVVVLMTPHSHVPRIVGTARENFSPEDVTTAHAWASNHKGRRRPIVTDFLGEDSSRLRGLLEKNHIAILARLGDGGKSTDKELGHLILGPKKSGNPYDEHDIRTIETIANELVIAIENALRFEEIQQFSQTLQQRVKHATTELRTTNHRLRELDSTKDDFISMASHQLRTPLTSVKGYISMVLDGDVGPLNDSQRKMLQQSYNSSQQMVYLISDLLNLSRLNSGKFVIEVSAVELNEVVQEEIDQLAETAKARSITLAYDKPSHFPTLMLDSTKIRQVIMNFIDNAIYYTPSGGTITVGLQETPTAVEFTVKDTGIGVPKSVQHKLFSKFYRADNAKKARPDGTGLGLFMAKKVIVAQDGVIIFDSEEGKGSTFGFSFSKAGHIATDQH